MSGLPDDMKDALVDAMDDLWGCIGHAEMQQLQPETVKLCRFIHFVRWHDGDWTDWKHQPR